jgi:hypothetical protein
MMVGEPLAVSPGPKRCEAEGRPSLKLSMIKVFSKDPDKLPNFAKYLILDNIISLFSAHVPAMQ